jgi:ABC-2 type transport system permease protein
MAELLKLRHRPAVAATLATWLVLAAVFGYLFPYFNYTSAATQADRADALPGLLQALPAAVPTTSISGLPVFAAALAILLGVLATGSEYGWRTVTIVFTQGLPRTTVTVCKIGALLLVLLAVLLASFAINTGAAVLVAAGADRPVRWPSAIDLGAGLAAGILIAAMWCAGGVLLATVLRGTAVPLGLGIVWALAVENLLRTGTNIPVLGTLQQYTPGSAAGSLVATVGAPTQGAGGTPGITENLSGTTAAVVLLAYLIAFACATILTVRSRDVD